MTATVMNVNQLQRRKVSYASIDELLADVERVLLAPAVESAGRWSAGQNMQHLAKTIQCSYDGFPMNAPLPMRIMGRLFKGAILGSKPWKAGYQLKGPFLALAPERDVSREEGAAALRTQLERIKRGEQMTRKSPFLGAMSHEEWIRLHLKHADLHMSHLRFEGDDAAPAPRSR